jgi:hypothetical protein
MHRRPDWETERVALVLTFTARELGCRRRGRGEPGGGPSQKQLGMQSWGGSAKPTRRRPWRRFLRLKAAVLLGPGASVSPCPVKRVGGCGGPGLNPGGWARPKAKFCGGWLRCPADPAGHGLGVSWGQGETRQFEADRLRKWAARHSNF